MPPLSVGSEVKTDRAIQTAEYKTITINNPNILSSVTGTEVKITGGNAAAKRAGKLAQKFHHLRDEVTVS